MSRTIVQGIIFVALALLILLSSHYLFTLRLQSDFMSLFEWKISQFFYSYEYGFMKRAIVGSFFDLFSIGRNQSSLFMFSVAIASLSLVAIYIWFAEKLSIIGNRSRVLILFIFLISPATVMHMGYDLGRFDFITLLLTLWMLFLTQGYIDSFRIASISALSAVALLAHEAFFFLQFFVIISILVEVLHRQGQSIWRVLPVILSAFGTMLLLALWGKPSPQTVAMITLAIEGAALPVNQDSLLVLDRTLMENISITFQMLKHEAMQARILQAVSLLLLYYLLFWKLLETEKVPLTGYQKLLFFSPFAVLPLFVFGYDFVRWVTAMIMDLFIVFAYLVHVRGIKTVTFVKSKTFKIIFLLLLLVSIFGPMGAVEMFPLTMG